MKILLFSGYQIRISHSSKKSKKIITLAWRNVIPLKHRVVSGTIPKKKPSAYLERVLQETEAIIREDEAVQGVKGLISRRLVQSFKNGITVGMKKAGKVE